MVELQTKDLVDLGSNPVRKQTSFLIDLSPPVHSECLQAYEFVNCST